MAVLLRGQRRKLGQDALLPLPARLATVARPLLLLIRLAVALARSRSDSDLPDFSLASDGADHFELGLTPGWLASHPLSARGLQLERAQLGAVGLRLRIVTLKIAQRPDRAT